MTISYHTMATSIGLRKINKASQTSQAVRITTVKFGDSNPLSLPENQVQEYQPTGSEADLKNVVYTTAPLRDEVMESHATWREVEALIPHNEGPFWVREMGFYDSDGDLIFITAIPPRSKPNSSAAATDMSFTLAINIVNQDSIEIVIDPSTAAATQASMASAFRQHIAEANPHSQYYLKPEADTESMLQAARLAANLKRVNVGRGQGESMSLLEGNEHKIFNEVSHSRKSYISESWGSVTEGQVLFELDDIAKADGIEWTVFFRQTNWPRDTTATVYTDGGIAHYLGRESRAGKTITIDKDSYRLGDKIKIVVDRNDESGVELRIDGPKETIHSSWFRGVSI